jgi:hypothetical protein
VNRQRQHWEQEAYRFGAEEVREIETEGLESDDGMVYLEEAKEALSKLSQHEARRAKTPQRMRGRRAWD